MIVFRNPGVIDVASITTFGVSSKEKPGAIGFFGTGLKYAIAILLRHGCSVTIYAGGEQLVFGTERVRIRVDDFTFVTLNGQRLGFTTELGKTWELWAAFRELYCNTLDENGTVTSRPGIGWSKLDPADDETVIAVHGDVFQDVWDRRDEIILNKEPLLKSEGATISHGPCQHVFYRGVRAATLDKPSLYTYNILRKVDLTEDRTIKYPWDVTTPIKKAIMEANDARLIEHVLTAGDGTFEADIEFGGVAPSDVFLDVVTRLYKAFDARLNKSAWGACRAWLQDRLLETEHAELNRVDTARLAKAIAFCKQIGFPVDAYPIIVTEFLGTDVWGQAHNNRIYLGRRVFEMGTKMVAGTLIEEYLHLRHGVRDETRQMQNLLMDTICSLGEQITGEPL